MDASAINQLMREITPVKSGDPVTHVASAARINAIMGLLRFLVTGDNIITGPNMRKKAQDGWVVLDAGPAGKGGSLARPTPFLVNHFDSSDYSCNVYPGYVEGVMAKISDTLLENDPAPKLYIGAEGGIYLRVDIAIVEATIDFRNNVAGVKVTYVDGPKPLDDDGDDADELKMIWDDEDVRDSGYFFLKVAGVLTAGETFEVKITQYLFTSIRSIALLGDDVFILTT